MRRIDDVDVDVQRRRYARVTELFLRDLDGYPQIVQELSSGRDSSGNLRIRSHV